MTIGGAVGCTAEALFLNSGFGNGILTPDGPEDEVDVAEVVPVLNESLAFLIGENDAEKFVDVERVRVGGCDVATREGAAELLLALSEELLNP